VDLPLQAGMRVVLPPNAAAHLTRVLRLTEGDPCVLFNGHGGEFACRLAVAGKREVAVDVGAHDPVERESPLRILLLQGLARGERMDFIVQKATELGVAAIRPVHTLHSGVKLDDSQVDRKLAHWRSVATGACEQCQRNRLPDILPPVTLAEAIAAAPEGDRWTLSLTPGRTPARLSGTGSGLRATLLVGPEGGLAPAEEQAAAAAGFEPLYLGPRVLRTETAALAALAVLGALRGDLVRR
jgi:16S rRNA (uracil1498-N3)-methyltransferase